MTWPAWILAVDDNADNRNLVRQLCAHLGYGSREAADGLEAMRLARAERPDLIVMDLALPYLDGWEATARLKADPATRGIPVVAVSAHVTRADRERALAAGCVEFLPKPIELEGFRSMLARYLAPGDPER
ncbi:MAG: response regulator [Candidatus Sericytochromatia bacterium]|nr:response regulator [Candidatus Tanganyikabacteria bacterium]